MASGPSSGGGLSVGFLFLVFGFGLRGYLCFFWGFQEGLRCVLSLLFKKVGLSYVLLDY